MLNIEFIKNDNYHKPIDIMKKKVLLLGASYEVLHFISMRRAIKLYFNNKIEVISHWNDDLFFGYGSIKSPAIIKLIKPPRRQFFGKNFNRKAVIKRDKSSCQYCGIKLSYSEITIDHIIPKVLGGINSFSNCVVSCKECNGRKGDCLLEETDLSLLRKPTLPSFSDKKSYLDNPEYWHPEWNNFLDI